MWVTPILLTAEEESERSRKCISRNRLHVPHTMLPRSLGDVAESPGAHLFQLLTLGTAPNTSQCLVCGKTVVAVCTRLHDLVHQPLLLNRKYMILINCSILSLVTCFVIRSAGCTLVHTFLAVNLPAVTASCIHKCCTSAWFQVSHGCLHCLPMFQALV